MSDDRPVGDNEPTENLDAVTDEGGADEFDRWRADNEPVYTEPPPAEQVAATREPGWWRVPAAILVVLALLALIFGLAAGSDDDGEGDEIASTATSFATSTSSSTTSTTIFTTSTAPAVVTVPTTGVATTVATTPPTATTARPGDRPLSIEARWTPEVALVGETVVFDVRTSDPDASPIREGACGNGNGVSFGDGGRHPTSCGAPCPSGLTGSSARGSAAFQYSHVYGAPGVYTVTMTFASGDRCSTPGASVRTISFNVTVTQ